MQPTAYIFWAICAGIGYLVGDLRGAIIGAVIGLSLSFIATVYTTHRRKANNDE